MTFQNVVPGNTWNYTYSDYTPYLRDIIDISNAQNAVVEFGTAHPYTAGEIVSFRVSKPYGMTEINNLQARVLSGGATNITVEVDTSNFTSFVYPPVGTVEIPAQTVPVGSGIIPSSNPATMNLEDVFDNRRLT